MRINRPKLLGGITSLATDVGVQVMPDELINLIPGTKLIVTVVLLVVAAGLFIWDLIDWRKKELEWKKYAASFGMGAIIFLCIGLIAAAYYYNKVKVVTNYYIEKINVIAQAPKQIQKLSDLKLPPKYRETALQLDFSRDFTNPPSDPSIEKNICCWWITAESTSKPPILYGPNRIIFVSFDLPTKYHQISVEGINTRGPEYEVKVYGERGTVIWLREKFVGILRIQVIPSPGDK